MPTVFFFVQVVCGHEGAAVPAAAAPLLTGPVRCVGGVEEPHPHRDHTMH
jgi:hypothetical protein